jgi:cell division septum initiation protein DivIVA
MKILTHPKQQQKLELYNDMNKNFGSGTKGNRHEELKAFLDQIYAESQLQQEITREIRVTATSILKISNQIEQ